MIGAAKFRFERRALAAALLATGLILPITASAQIQPAAETPPTVVIPPAPATSAPPVGSPAIPAVPDAAAAPVPPIPGAALTLPRDLSPWGMFMAADVVVKAVMVGLAFASVLTWTIWFAKAIELLMVRRRMQATIDALSQARSWSDASARVK